jgi:hypothetical protein
MPPPSEPHYLLAEVITDGARLLLPALLWGALKTYLANSPTLTIQGRIRQVHAFFRERTPEQLLATAAPHSSPWLARRLPAKP